jgi:exopolyphosphatase/pppGpp-phosphohydrolase
VNRHDVIVPGALIVLLIMRGIGVAKLCASGGMEGYLKYLLLDEASR